MSIKGMLAVGTLLLAACGPGRVELRPAKTCDSTNLEGCKQRCADKQGRACYRLGWFHETGQGVGKSMQRAAEHYEKACEANFAVACRALGMMLWTGETVKPDRKKAIAYYQKACDLGLPEACPTDKMLKKAEGKSKKKASGSGSGGISLDVSVGTDGDKKDDGK